MARAPMVMGLILYGALSGCVADRAAKPGLASQRCELPLGKSVPEPALQERQLQYAIAAHEKLRAFSNSPLTKADVMILVFFARAHHSAQQLSYVATRNPAGWWRLNKAGSFQSEFDTGPTAYPNEINNLTSEQALAIDTLIADPCLYAEAIPIHEEAPPIGVWSTQLIIVTPHRTRVVSVDRGILPGLSGRLVKVVTGW